MTDVQRGIEMFGANLRRLREQRGLGRAALGRKADVSHNSLLAIESGDRGPEFGTLLKIADGLDVDPGDLLRGLRLAERRPKIQDPG